MYTKNAHILVDTAHQYYYAYRVLLDMRSKRQNHAIKALGACDKFHQI